MSVYLSGRYQAVTKGEKMPKPVPMNLVCHKDPCLDLNSTAFTQHQSVLSVKSTDLNIIFMQTIHSCTYLLNQWTRLHELRQSVRVKACLKGMS